MSTKILPMKLALLHSYASHRKFFYLDYMQNFKLFAKWLLPDVDMDVEYKQLPWYQRNYEVQELAKILKCKEQTVLDILKEYYDEQKDSKDL